MFTEQQIHDLVKKHIEDHENLGDQAGSSGHLSHVSYSLDEVETRFLKKGKLEVNFRYTLHYLTEFGYEEVEDEEKEIEEDGFFPLPPRSSSRSGQFIIDA